MSKTALKPKPWGLWATLGFSGVVAIVFFLSQTIVAGFFLARQAAEAPSAPIEVLAQNLAEDGFFLAIATLVSAPLCTALIVLFARLRKRISVKSYLALHPPAWKQVVLWCLITMVVVVAIDLLRIVVGQRAVPTFVTNVYETAGVLPLLYLAVVVLAPVFEEVFFRGFLFQGLRYSALGKAGAVIIPAFLWAIIHLQYDWYDIMGIFIFGIVLGGAQLRTGSLYIPIAMHAFNNLLSLLQVTLRIGT